MLTYDRSRTIFSASKGETGNQVMILHGDPEVSIIESKRENDSETEINGGAQGVVAAMSELDFSDLNSNSASNALAMKPI